MSYFIAREVAVAKDYLVEIAAFLKGKLVDGVYAHARRAERSDERGREGELGEGGREMHACFASHDGDAIAEGFLSAAISVSRRRR